MIRYIPTQYLVHYGKMRSLFYLPLTEYTCATISTNANSNINFILIRLKAEKSIIITIIILTMIICLMIIIIKMIIIKTTKIILR